MVYEYRLTVWNATINKEEVVEGIVFCDYDKRSEDRTYNYAEVLTKLEEYYDILEVLEINFLTSNCVLELMDDDLKDEFDALKGSWADV